MEKIDCKMYLKAKENNDYRVIKYLLRKYPEDCTIKYDYLVSLINNNKINDAKNYIDLLLNDKNTKNNDEILKIIAKFEYKNGNINNSKKHFTMLLNSKYKNYAILMLGKIEAIMRNYEEAEKYFSLLQKKDNQIIKENALNALLLLYIKKKKYAVALRKCVNSNIYVDDDIIIYLCNQLGINYDYDLSNYNQTQLNYYNEAYALNHIYIRHRKDFNNNVNIDKLFNNAKKLLFPKYKLNDFVLNDRYVIPYPNISKNGEKYLKVITLPNTKNILTMYPVESRYIFDDYDCLEEQTFVRTKKNN